MQSILDNIVDIDMSVHHHLIYLFIHFIKSVLYQNNLAIFSLST